MCIQILKQLGYEVDEGYRMKPEGMKITVYADLIFWKQGVSKRAMEIVTQKEPTHQNFLRLSHLRNEGMRIVILMQQNNLCMEL